MPPLGALPASSEWGFGTSSIASPGSVAARFVLVDHRHEDLFAVALPPFRPAAFFCAVVPPCLDEPPDPALLPPRFEAPGELAMRAARPFDIPLSFRASYCFSFLTAMSDLLVA